MIYSCRYVVIVNSELRLAYCTIYYDHLGVCMCLPVLAIITYLLTQDVTVTLSFISPF